MKLNHGAGAGTSSVKCTPWLNSPRVCRGKIRSPRNGPPHGAKGDLIVPLTFRPARAEDLAPATELVVRSMNELCERHGFGPMGAVRPPKFALFSLADDPNGLWIAEDAAEIRGFGFSWVCGDLWFLAQLFVAPGRQASGIGGELLKRTLGQVPEARAATRALITFSFNAVSQGLYMRHGLYPRCPIYFFKAARETVAGRAQGAQLRHAPIECTEHHLDRLSRIDAHALGVPRAKHHAFLLNDGESKGIMLFDDRDECVGYAYLADGHVGPLAVADPALAGAAFRTALNLALQSGSAQVSAFLPGPCESALRVALEHGMRITIPMVLMSTREFGDWTRYLPRNPGFL